MVSGLVTSPKLHFKMSSGEATFNLIAVKSFKFVILFVALLYLIRCVEHLPSFAQELDVEAKCFELVNKHVKGGRRVGALDLLFTDDGLIGGSAAHDVVRLDGEHF